MIKVTIYENGQHEWIGFDAEDHAGYADSGSDIVCAAASVLMINTINAIEKFTEEKFSVSSGDIEEVPFINFRFDKHPGHDARLLLETMLLGLQDIENNREYEPYIDIIFEEV